jgi:membrane protease YdiL (CAAX protease family)
MHRASVDLIVVIAGYMLVAIGGRAVGLPFPGAFAMVAAVLLASWRLSRASESWRSVGLTKPASWPRVGLSVPLLYIVTVLIVASVVNPLARAMEWPSFEVSAYARVRGNPAALAQMLALIWTVVAFGEELVFRGFVLSRMRLLFGETAAGGAFAVLLQSALFGIGHFYLGARGILVAAVVGIVYGTWYMLRGRNLWPLIIAHGVTDTISMVAIYAGVFPQ